MNRISLDLRQRGDMAAHSWLYYQLRELDRSCIYDILSDEAPALVMESVSLQLRHEISWRITEQGPPLWRVEVRHRDLAPIQGLADLLERDHLRLDHLFAQALHSANAGDMETCARALKAFEEGLQRHLQAEDEVLAPAFRGPNPGHDQDPTTIMLREHQQILEQLALLSASFVDGLPPAEEVAPLLGLLSGQLAKHEGREEQNLFPLWNRALKAAGAEAEQALVDRIERLLRPTADEP